MTIGAIATKDQIVGGQRQTDGLWKHRSILDADNLRATGQQVAQGGRGLELLVYVGGPTCYVQGYDRDTSQYIDVAITGKNINLIPNGGGVLNLPANCIGTAQLQANAANGPVVGYQAAPAFSTTATGAWVNTPVTVSHTSVTGGMIRIEWSIDLMHSALGAGFQVGLARDGVTQAPLATLNAYQANYVIHVSGVWYTQPPAGTYTYTLQVNNLNAGTLQTYTGSYSMLWVSEQKR